jgi:hypothetical protein
MKKKYLLTVIASFTIAFSFGQDSRGEFATQDNGLMYSTEAIGKLKQMVEQQNIRYKTCPLNKTYHSYGQSNIIQLTFRSKTNDLKSIINSLKNNTSYNKLITNYKSYLISSDTDKKIILSPYKEDKYLSGDPSSGFDSYYVGTKNLALHKWTYDYSKKDEYTENYELEAFFLKKEFISIPINEEYAKLIQYVDCMVDTTTLVMLSQDYDYSSGNSEMN